MNSPARQTEVAWLTLLLIFFLAGRVLTFNNDIYSTDEGNLSMTGVMILNGEHPYAETIENRTPLAHYLVAAVYAIAGAWNLPAVRVVWSLMLIGAGLVLWYLVRRQQSPLAAGFSLALYFFLNNYGMPFWDTLACHNIHLVEAFVIAGYAAILLPWKVEPIRRGFAGGLFLTLGIAAKQMAIFDILGLLAFLGILALGGRSARGWSMKVAGGMAAGFIATAAVCSLLLASIGAFNDFIRMAISFNLEIYGRELAWSTRIQNFLNSLLRPAFLVPLILAVPAVIVGAVRFFRQAWTEADWKGHQELLPYACWLLATLAIAAIQGRGFGHHYFTAFPPISVLAAWTLVRAARQATRLFKEQAPHFLQFLRKWQESLRLILVALVIMVAGKPPPGHPDRNP